MQSTERWSSRSQRSTGSSAGSIPSAGRWRFTSRVSTVSLDVRPDCVITLRGERVKLRLIQPRDRVRVEYTEHPGARVADTIEVQPGGPAPS